METDKKNKILNIKIHHQPRHMDDKIIIELCKKLNETETIFPQTDYMIKYSLLKE